MRRHRGVLRGRVPALRLVPAYRHARPDPGEGCTRARAHAQHTHWPRSVLWQMLVSGLRGGVLPSLGVTAAPGLGLCWMHTCTALAALLHRAPCHVRRQQQGYTLFLASYTRSLCIKCGAVLVNPPPLAGLVAGCPRVRQTDAGSQPLSKCARASQCQISKCTEIGGAGLTQALTCRAGHAPATPIRLRPATSVAR